MPKAFPIVSMVLSPFYSSSHRIYEACNRFSLGLKDFTMFFLWPKIFYKFTPWLKDFSRFILQSKAIFKVSLRP